MLTITRRTGKGRTITLKSGAFVYHAITASVTGRTQITVLHKSKIIISTGFIYSRREAFQFVRNMLWRYLEYHISHTYVMTYPQGDIIVQLGMKDGMDYICALPLRNDKKRCEPIESFNGVYTEPQVLNKARLVLRRTIKPIS